MHIFSASLRRQILGAAVGIAVAGALYVTLAELSYRTASAAALPPSPLVVKEENEQLQRIRQRVQRSLATRQPRLPSSMYEEATPLHPGANLAEPIRPQEETPDIMTADTPPLPDSGAPLFAIVSISLGYAGVRTSLSRRRAVS